MVLNTITLTLTLKYTIYCYVYNFYIYRKPALKDHHFYKENCVFYERWSLRRGLCTMDERWSLRRGLCTMDNCDFLCDKVVYAGLLGKN
jgi:hypothetical protein